VELTVYGRVGERSAVQTVQVECGTCGAAEAAQGMLSISGRVFDDSNDDGVQGADEAGPEGGDVLLTRQEGGSSTTRTDRKGCYIFTGLLPGGNMVDAEARENWTATVPAEGVHEVGLIDVHESEIDFGFKLTLANQSPETTGFLTEAEQIKVLGIPSSEKFSVAFSPDGRTLASGAT